MFTVLHSLINYLSEIKRLAFKRNSLFNRFNGMRRYFGTLAFASHESRRGHAVLTPDDNLFAKIA